MVDREPRRGIKERVALAAFKVNGLEFLGVAGIGVNRLANGGSVGRAIAEIGLGVAAAAPLTALGRVRESSREKLKIAAATTLGVSTTIIGGIGAAELGSPSGKYELAAAVLFWGTGVVTSSALPRNDEPSSEAVHSISESKT